MYVLCTYFRKIHKVTVKPKLACIHAFPTTAFIVMNIDLSIVTAARCRHGILMPFLHTNTYFYCSTSG